MKTINKCLCSFFLLLSSTAAIANFGILSPVNYSETVYTDSSRTRNGSAATDPDNVNGPRQLDVRVYQPAVTQGSGPPIRISMIPKVFNGTYANQPHIISDRGFQLSRSWSDNVPKPGSYPIIIMRGGAGGNFSNFKQAETIASAGYIVIVSQAYGTDRDSCPLSICPTAISRTALRDGRILLTAAENGQLGFPANKIKKDANGLSIAGCVGGSAGSFNCLRIAAGTSTLNSNSIPNENATDPRFRAVFAGDEYPLTDSNFNAAHLTAAVGIYASGVFQNWPRDFANYSNAAKRVFYDLSIANHNIGYMGADTLCQFMSEYIRIYHDGLVGNGETDVTFLRDPVVPWALEGCSPQYLTGFESLPSNVDLSGTLSSLLPHIPLGVSIIDDQSVSNFMSDYYTVNFLNWILKGDPIAALLSRLPVFPGLLDNIYVNSVPGIAANNFNLQNKQIDFTPIPGTNHYKTTITSRSGLIPDPSTIPGVISIFGNAWDDAIGPQITPAFGSFPILNGTITSTKSIAISTNGYILPESSMYNSDGVFAAKRLQGWFGDRGTWSIAAFGSDLASNFFGAPGTGQVWVSNTPQRLQITWYQVLSYEFPNLPGINVQCTLFPDGRIRLEYDSSIPSPGVITGEFGDPGTIVVGISNGRLHVDNGFYNFLKKPVIRTLTDVMNGKSTSDADAIYEVYTQAVPAQ